jgi:hypothetical protein
VLFDYRVVPLELGENMEISVSYDPVDVSTLFSTRLLSIVGRDDTSGLGSLRTVLTKSLQVHVMPEQSLFAELCFEKGHGSSSISRIDFQIGRYPVQPGATNQVRKTLIVEAFISNVGTQLVDYLKRWKLVVLSQSNENTRQFIAYQTEQVGNSSIIYLITNINGLEKNSMLIVTPIVLKLPNIHLNTIRYVESLFLLLDQKISVFDNNRQSQPTLMNYYVRAQMGLMLTEASFQDIKNLTRGRFLDSYSNVERDLVLVDFLMPDLDGIPDESPISTYYYDKTNQKFDIYLEENVQNPGSVVYMPDSYSKMNGDLYSVEVYQQGSLVNNKLVPNGQQIYYNIKNRLTGVYLLKAFQILEGTIEYVGFLKSENLLIVKLVQPATGNGTFFDKLVSPGIQIEILTNVNTSTVVEGYAETQFRPYKIYDIDLTCPKVGEVHSQLSYSLKFVLVDPEKEYFGGKNSDTSPKYNDAWQSFLAKFKVPFAPSAEKVPTGMDISVENGSLLRGSFLEYFIGQNDNGVFNINSLNFMLMADQYSMNLDTDLISKPVYFETRTTKRIKSRKTLILDSKGRTAFYIQSEKSGNFDHFKDADDSRDISEVDLIDNSDAMINISKNIFSLDIKTMKEKPLTGIGSFCKDSEALKIPGMNHFLLCITQDSFLAHYTEERFLAEQTKINIIQTPLKSIFSSDIIVKMRYSLRFPNHIFVIAKKGTEYYLQPFNMYATMSLQINKIGSPITLEIALGSPSRRMVSATSISSTRP